MPELDDDDLDGCELDFAEHAHDDATAELYALFPDGKPDKAMAAKWNALGQAIADGEFG